MPSSGHQAKRQLIAFWTDSLYETLLSIPIVVIPSDLQDLDRSSGAIGIGLGVALFTLFNRLLTKGAMKGK